MLRLRPSELTLTPEDVDETLRRMAHRQALQGSRHASAQPGRPSLCRGPQRAVRDAITTLGDIPILRPQPQQAIFASVDDDPEDDPRPRTPSPRGRIDSVSGSMSPVRSEHATPGNAVAGISPGLSTMHLPFRPGRNHGGFPTHSSSVERQGEAATASPRQSSPHPEEIVNVDQTVQYPLPTRLATSSSTPELRGGGGSNKGRTHTSSQSQDSAPSQPQQERNRKSAKLPADATDPGAPYPKPSATEQQPILLLQGYFVANPQRHPQKLSYDFKERWLQAPQTEPRRASNRHTMPARSLSSSAAPAFPRSTIQPATRDASSKDVFGKRSEGRRFSSETSATSAPYSLYELPPESRQSSGAQHSYPQYDGSTASEYVGRGAYRSVRPADLQLNNDSLQYSATNPASGGQHGISPLPSMPYMRAQGHYVSPYAAPPSFPGQQLFNAMLPRPTDAATAAIHNLASPLEPFADHYRSLNAQAPEWHPRPAQLSGVHTTNSFSGAGTPAPAQNNMTNQQNMSRAQLGRPSSVQPQQHPTAFYYPRAGTFTSPPRLPSQPTGRGVQATRANQRSSENAPVRPPAHSSGPSGNSQVQIHRAAFERLHNVNITTTENPQQGAPQHSLHQTASHRNIYGGPQTQPSLRRVPGYSGHPESRRRTPQTSSSPARTRQQPPSSQSGTSSPAGMPRMSPGAPPRPPRSDEPSMRGGGARRRVTPVASSSSLLQPPRNFPSGSMAPGRTSIRTSLRSPILRATTSARPLRRVPPQQRDQENSGAGEEQLMRREAAAIEARHGEDNERDTMDETPPRVGMVERRMFS